ncbi:MAG TPA: NAD(+) synthase [Thermoplasmata archaeon]|nr:MAG TPA: NAD(+) synthase [Thermoplasmata archaeon]
MLKNSQELKEKLITFIKETVAHQFKKDGIVIGVSGGVDSAVIAALAVDSMGSDRVYGLILPEKESSPSSRQLGIDLCKALKIRYDEVPITPMLESFNIYSKKEALIRELFSHYDPTIHTTSLSRPPIIAAEKVLNIPSLNLLKNREVISTKRLTASQFFYVLSLQNVKQRTRMIVEYMFAEKMNYAVCGTTNKTELLTGFFVKYGDGGVDLEPIANCYKLQVYQLAELLHIDKRIITRAPSPDTWSHFTSDEDISLRIPYDILDQLLYADENHLSQEIVQQSTKLDLQQIEWANKHIHSLKNAARVIQMSPPVCL